MGNKSLDNDQALCKKSHLDSKHYYFEHHHIPKGGEVRKALKSLVLKYRGQALFLTRLSDRY
jgi:hypothetical protein